MTDSVKRLALAEMCRRDDCAGVVIGAKGKGLREKSRALVLYVNAFLGAALKLAKRCQVTTLQNYYWQLALLRDATELKRR